MGWLVDARFYPMRLQDVAHIRIDLLDADFWLVRRGSIESVGQPTREYSPYHIGIRVIETRLLLPDYLYYVFMHMHNSGQWQPHTHGTLSLVHIRVQDVKKIILSPY